MKRQPKNFTRRQYMLRNDFEAFYYSDDDLGGVEPHQHSFYELLFFLEGDVTYWIGSSAYALLPGDLLLIPQGTRHHPEFRQGGRYRRVVLWLAPDYVESLDQGRELLSCFGQKDDQGNPLHLCRFDPEDSRRLVECAASISDELSCERPFSREMAVLLVNQLLILLSRMVRAGLEVTEGSQDLQQMVKDVVRYINSNLSRDLTLDYIADHFFISKFYLSRAFKQHMNVTIHSYIRQRRLFLAKQLLYNGVPPTEVYRQCGYSDYSSFFRAFKEKYGCAPKHFCFQNGEI